VFTQVVCCAQSTVAARQAHRVQPVAAVSVLFVTFSFVVKTNPAQVAGVADRTYLSIDEEVNHSKSFHSSNPFIYVCPEAYNGQPR
jgi:hypothetical protein